MGLIPIVFNRTETNLKIILRRFNKKRHNKETLGFTDVDKLVEFVKGDIHLSLIISTVPGSADL